MSGRILVVAGSDSGGGAGIQAELKTVTTLGGYAATAITALTAQNTQGVFGIVGVGPGFIAQQMQVVLADSWSRRLAGTDIRVESMHPGWVDTPGVAEYLPRFRVITRPLLRDLADGADTAVWLVATRPDSTPGHFWHDRAQRPTTFGWQRHEKPATLRRFLAEVSALTGTPDTWTGLRG